MRISKALEHFKWNLENRWKPTEKDIEAYKSIIEYKQKVEDENLERNNNLAKLWIHQLILLSNSNMYSGERCIQVLDEILTKSVYDWGLELQKQLSIMKFNSLTKQGASDEELTEALAWKPDEEYVIKFINQNITRIILKYEK